VVEQLVPAIAVVKQRIEQLGRSATVYATAREETERMTAAMENFMMSDLCMEDFLFEMRRVRS